MQGYAAKETELLQTTLRLWQDWHARRRFFFSVVPPTVPPPTTKRLGTVVGRALVGRAVERAASLQIMASCTIDGCTGTHTGGAFCSCCCCCSCCGGLPKGYRDGDACLDSSLGRVGEGVFRRERVGEGVRQTPGEPDLEPEGERSRSSGSSASAVKLSSGLGETWRLNSDLGGVSSAANMPNTLSSSFSTRGGGSSSMPKAWLESSRESKLVQLSAPAKEFSLLLTEVSSRVSQANDEMSSMLFSGRVSHERWLSCWSMKDLVS
mmetsp:Transcript_25253/g.47130  ORF Transcript_25253/g.47130 Transcript_25253/m.47130 type:complete len:265 (+) Transcript_25253:581-1375(+)